MSSHKQWFKAYLGLGSNIGSGKSYLLSALSSLKKHEQIVITRISSIYVATSVDGTDQADYSNAAVAIQTSYSPMALLEVCQSIEKLNDKVFLYHWGPRTLDIDILSYDELVLNTLKLTLPHPQISHRDFVIKPLLEIEPQIAIPNLGFLKNIPQAPKNIL